MSKKQPTATRGRRAKSKPARKKLSLKHRIAALKSELRAEVTSPTRVSKKGSEAAGLDAFEARELQARVAAMEVKERVASAQGAAAQRQRLRQEMRTVGNRLKRAKGLARKSGKR